MTKVAGSRRGGRVAASIIAAVVGLAIVFGIALALPVPSVGRVAYTASNDLNRILAGLESREVPAGDTTLPITVGGPSHAPHTLLLLHGYTAEKAIWYQFARHLTGQYRVIIPDLAGHGEARFDPALSYSIPSQADRLSALLNSLGVRRVVVVGNSMGGQTAAQFTLRHPSQAEALVVMAPAGVKDPQPSLVEKLLANGTNPLVVRSRADFDQLISLTAAKPPFLPPAVRAALAQEFERRADAYDRIGQDFLGRDLVEGQLDNISIPCLVIWGEKDEIISPSSAQVWHRHLRNSKLVTMPGIGHLPMLEDPNGSAQVVAQFIATLPSSAERSR
jgi:abhydrolase domain-containing protein 6